MKKKEKVLPKKKTPTTQPKRKGFAIQFFLFFFVSVWMFILGIIVGRGTAPVRFDIEKLQKELTVLKAKDIRQEEKRYKIHRDAGSDKTDLRFYEELKDTQSDDKLLMDTAQQKTVSAPEKSDPAGQMTGTTEQSEKMEASREGNADFSEDKVVVVGNFTIQVASLKDSNVADKMIADLNQKGYPAYRATGEIAGRGAWFRVRIGSFNNRTDAENILNRLKKDGFKAILIRR